MHNDSEDVRPKDVSFLGRYAASTLCNKFKTMRLMLSGVAKMIIFFRICLSCSERVVGVRGCVFLLWHSITMLMKEDTISPMTSPKTANRILFSALMSGKMENANTTKLTSVVGLPECTEESRDEVH